MHGDNRDCKAATATALSHETEHLVHWVVLVQDCSLYRAYPCINQINPCITDVKNDHIRHIYVCLVAIPMSAHYFLLSLCLIFFHVYGNLFWKTSTDFSLNYCGSCLSEKWYTTKISVPHAMLVIFHSVLRNSTSHLVLLRLSHIAITLFLCLTIFFQQVKKRKGFRMKKGECDGGESISFLSAALQPAVLKNKQTYF